MTKTDKKQVILESNFTKVPNAALDYLDIYERAVLTHIIRRCGPKYGGTFYESMRNAASCVGISLSKYQKVIKKLEKKDVIEIQKQAGRHSVIVWNHPEHWKVELYTCQEQTVVSETTPHVNCSLRNHTTVVSETTPHANCSLRNHTTVVSETTPSTILVEEDPNKEDPRREEEEIYKEESQPVADWDTDEHIKVQSLLEDWRMYILENASWYKVDGNRVWGNGIEHAEALSELLVGGEKLIDLRVVFEYWKSGKSWFNTCLTPKKLLQQKDGQSIYSQLYLSAQKALSKSGEYQAYQGMMALEQAKKDGTLREDGMPF